MRTGSSVITVGTAVLRNFIFVYNGATLIMTLQQMILTRASDGGQSTRADHLHNVTCRKPGEKLRDPKKQNRGPGKRNRVNNRFRAGVFRRYACPRFAQALTQGQTYGLATRLKWAKSIRSRRERFLS